MEIGQARGVRSTIRAAMSEAIGLDWASRVSRLIAATAFAILLVIWTVAAGAIWRSHTQAIQGATTASQTLSLMATAFTSKSVSATGLVLSSMLDWVAEEDIETVEQFESILSERRFFDKLRDRIANVNSVDVATFIAPNGKVVMFTRGYPPSPINLSDRDYFKAQLAKDAPPVSLGNVVQNRGTGRWTFYLARQVRSHSGLILGVVIVGIESEYLADFYRRISPSKDIVLSFWRDDGTLLATSGSRTELLGKRFPEAGSLKILSQRPAGGTEYLTTRRLIADTVDEARVLTAKPVPNIPGYVAVSVGMESFLQPWRADRNGMLFIAVLLSLAVGTVARQAQSARRAEYRRRANESEQRVLRAVVDMPLALTAVLDGEGRVLRSNESFDRFFRRSDRPRGLKVVDMPEADAIARFVVGNGEQGEAEIRLNGPTGSQRIVRFAMTRQNLQGWGPCSIIVGTDETAQRAAQVAIAQSAKLITLGEMATGMAHELNQPINVIHMAAQNALAEIVSMEPGDPKPTPTPDLLEFLASKLNTILSQTVRSASLISHMRVFGRTPKETATPFDARNVCNDVLSLIGQQVRTCGISIEIDPRTGPAVVVGHQTMLEQVLINVVLNARDALLTVAERRMRIEIGCWTDDRTVVVEVRDNGPGIPEGIRDRIFDPFFTTKDVGQGTGLGLAISYGIVRDMRGSIRVAPSDVGARIRIELPAARQDSQFGNCCSRHPEAVGVVHTHDT